MSVASPPEQEQVIDLRCPFGPKQLLAKVVQHGDYHGMTPDRTLMELSCRDCAKRERKKDPAVSFVVHRFNVLGQLVESVIRRSTPAQDL